MDGRKPTKYQNNPIMSRDSKLGPLKFEPPHRDILYHRLLLTNSEMLLIYQYLCHSAVFLVFMEK